MFLLKEHSFKQRAIQIPTQFRFALLQHPPASKIAIQKNILKYQKNGTRLNLDKMRSVTRFMVRMEDNITVGQQSLEMIKVS